MDKEFILGIDASNIRAGGGMTHLVELLRSEVHIKKYFSKVIIWSGKATLDRLHDENWLIKKNPNFLNGNFIKRTFWQKFKLANAARKEHCDIIFVPGGSFSCNFRPIVTFSQNLLPFQKSELYRYGISWMTLKMLFLRQVQSSSFRKANGVIFLNEFAKNIISNEIGINFTNFSIIPHGINPTFFTPPKEQKDINCYSLNKPFEILYLSIIDVYKHQCNVADGVAILRNQGIPVNIRFVGPAYAPALKKLLAKIEKLDPKSEFIHYDGKVDHNYLPNILQKADMFLFASSCENMPNVLLEGMAAGLPIACSNLGPMPEVLGNAGIYFNPEDSVNISEVVGKFIVSAELRNQNAQMSFELARKYSWDTCASQTFQFLNFIARNYNNKSIA